MTTVISLKKWPILAPFVGDGVEGDGVSGGGVVGDGDLTSVGRDVRGDIHGGNDSLSHPYPP